MSGPQLQVGRRVVADIVRLAAEEVPGVLRLGRGGPRWRSWLIGSPIRVEVRERRIDVRLTLVARPGHDLVAVAGQVRAAVAAAIERLLGLEAGSITIVLDGVGS
ncbi:MAG: Asp23/Gls24 family envelope stress response protein [Chloroflexota bacterium]